MVRVKRGVQDKSKHKKILKMAKGYRGRSKNVFRIAVQKVEKGLQYAIAIEGQKKEILGLCGYKRSMLGPENTE